MLFIVQATRTTRSADAWVCSEQLPTFFVEAINPANATRIAEAICGKLLRDVESVSFHVQPVEASWLRSLERVQAGV